RVAVLHARFEIVGLDVAAGDELRRKRARKQEAIGAVGVSRAHVPEAVEHGQSREDAIGGDDVVDDCVESRHDHVSSNVGSYAITICARSTLRYHALVAVLAQGISMLDRFATRAPLALLVFACVAWFLAA